MPLVDSSARNASLSVFVALREDRGWPLPPTKRAKNGRTVAAAREALGKRRSRRRGQGAMLCPWRRPSRIRYWARVQSEEPTSGLGPLSCSLRVNCSYWTILCFTLLDNRRYQRERRSVMWCNESLAVRATPIPYRGLGIALRFTSKSYKGRADERTRTADLLITSVRSAVAGRCTGLQIPYK